MKEKRRKYTGEYFKKKKNVNATISSDNTVSLDVTPLR